MSSWNIDVNVLCPECNNVHIKRREYFERRLRLNKPFTCTKCSNKLAALEKWHTSTEEERKIRIENATTFNRIAQAKITTEQRVERGKKSVLTRVRNGKIAYAEAVVKQWKTIKADPEKFANLKKQRSQTSKMIWLQRTPEERNFYVQKSLQNRGRSKSCDQFLSVLHENGIQLTAEHPINGFVVDAFYHETKTIIEFYGDFWHCNPKQFQDENRYCSWLKRTVKQQQNRDARRLGCFYRLGFQVLIVWESNWKTQQQIELQRIFSVIKNENLSINL